MLELSELEFRELGLTELKFNELPVVNSLELMELELRELTALPAEDRRGNSNLRLREVVISVERNKSNILELHKMS